MTEIVLSHVGSDPYVLNGDQGHDRAARRGELPDIGAQVGDQPFRTRACLRIGQVQFGF
ncbi:hypothetical protein D3C84_857830 [compost metagenome]